MVFEKGATNRTSPAGRSFTFHEKRKREEKVKDYEWLDWIMRLDNESLNRLMHHNPDEEVKQSCSELLLKRSQEWARKQ